MCCCAGSPPCHAAAQTPHAPQSWHDATCRSLPRRPAMLPGCSSDDPRLQPAGAGQLPGRCHYAVLQCSSWPSVCQQLAICLFVGHPSVSWPSVCQQLAIRLSIGHASVWLCLLRGGGRILPNGEKMGPYTREGGCK